MKKITSLCLIFLLMLNIMGYYGFFLGLEFKNSQHLSYRLDAGSYEDSETITLKIPLSIPYYPNTDFKRVDGEIEYNGRFYRLVKQKFHQDTLHIVCLRDQEGTILKQALADYVKTFADQSTDSSQQSKAPTFAKDYISTTVTLNHLATGWDSEITAAVVHGVTSDPFLSFTTPPPRV